MTTENIDPTILFRSDSSDWWNNALLRVEPDELYRYACGYRRAANILVGHVDENNRDQDFIAFPILFLYRHYLELKLKEIIFKGRMLIDEDANYPTHHNIATLWDISKRIVLKIWTNIDVSELNLTESCIHLISKFDQGSFAFRYPESKNGEPSLNGLGYANLRHIKDTMAEVTNMLDGICIAINEYVDLKHEMELEFCSE